MGADFVLDQHGKFEIAKCPKIFFIYHNSVRPSANHRKHKIYQTYMFYGQIRPKSGPRLTNLLYIWNIPEQKAILWGNAG